MNKYLLLLALLLCGIKTSIVSAADKNEEVVKKIENIEAAKAAMNRFKGEGPFVGAGESFPLMLGLLDYVINRELRAENKRLWKALEKTRNELRAENERLKEHLTLANSNLDGWINEFRALSDQKLRMGRNLIHAQRSIERRKRANKRLRKQLKWHQGLMKEAESYYQAHPEERKHHNHGWTVWSDSESASPATERIEHECKHRDPDIPGRGRPIPES